MLANVSEFFFKLHCPHIIHFTQFIKLSQREAAFAQILEGDLAVILTKILIGLGFFVPKFTEYHRDIYAAGGGVPAAGKTPPGAPAPGTAPGAAPGSPPAGSIAAASCPI